MKTIRSGAGRFFISGKRRPVSSGTMALYADALARRVVPDALQAQLLLGTLLGTGRLVRSSGGVSLVLSLESRHAWLAQWTYERLAPLVPAPTRRDGRIELRAAAHPFFAELASVLSRPARLRRVVGERALWLWATHRRVQDCERSGGSACTCGGAALSPVWLAAVTRLSAPHRRT